MFECARPFLDVSDSSPEAVQKAMNLGMVFRSLAVMPAAERASAMEARTATPGP